MTFSYITLRIPIDMKENKYGNYTIMLMVRKGFDIQLYAPHTWWMNLTEYSNDASKKRPENESRKKQHII